MGDIGSHVPLSQRTPQAADLLSEEQVEEVLRTIPNPLLRERLTRHMMAAEFLAARQLPAERAMNAVTVSDITIRDGVFYHHGRRTDYRLTVLDDGRLFVDRRYGGPETAFPADEATARARVTEFINAARD